MEQQILKRPTYEKLIAERAEVVKKIKDAIRHHIANTQWDGRTHWGPWFLDEKDEPQLLFEWVNPQGVLIPDLYDIPLRHVVGIYGGFDTIENWTLHMLGKSWSTFDDVLNLVEALSTLHNAGKCRGEVTA